ncbi:hypothetical protein NL471_27320, partial [Klebsiella pneumoniae]|nr:hypothetical protein [Klebsiella pneumoniae]
GNVRSAGIEALVSAKLGQGFAATATYAYNDSTYRNDIGSLKIAGKTTVDAPKHLLRGELNYDSKSLFGRVAANYMSKRY